MRIALDYNAALRQNAGIGRYTRDLVRAFLDLDSGDEVVLVYAARDLPLDHPGLRDLGALESQFAQVRSVGIPLSERWLTIAWQRARLPIPIERWSGPVDLVHAPDFVLPPVRRTPTLLTVHDLTFRVHPETAHANLRRYLDRAVPRSLARATHILADSQSTRRDLQRLMGVPPEKVTVLYPGVGQQFRRVDDSQRLQDARERLKLPDRFLFSVGTIEPRKNLQRLMRAFDQVRREHPPLSDVELVLGGKPGWLSEPIVTQARATPGVQLLGPVDDTDLPALYTLATATVYPSLYEGFGFPPLESLACGTPVLVSNTSSLPEVVGNVGILVDPADEATIARGITRLLTDESLADDARRRGPAQAARFGWPAAAQQLRAVYYSLAG